MGSTAGRCTRDEEAGSRHPPGRPVRYPKALLGINPKSQEPPQYRRVNERPQCPRKRTNSYLPKSTIPRQVG